MPGDHARSYHREELDRLFDRFGVSGDGLSNAEAQKRLRSEGPNELETRTSINPLLIFIGQFRSFIIYILLFAVVFSVLIGEYVDSIIILIILLANAVIGFYQELSAHKSLEALKKISTVQATVVRDGIPKVIAARELVPGDVVLLTAGDRVPADLRLIDAVELQAEESALTGESVPVSKKAGLLEGDVPLGDRFNMLFSATSLASGNCRALVVATGMKTELGRITELVREAEEEQTPLQRRLDRFGKTLSYVIIAICLIVFGLFFLGIRI